MNNINGVPNRMVAVGQLADGAYLYRAKCTDFGETWAYGTPYSDYLICGALLYRQEGDILAANIPDFEWVKINPSTLCRNTGATDCKGNRIFSEDMLFNREDKRLYVVKWDDEACGFKLAAMPYNNGAPQLDFSLSGAIDLEVVGNTFDNTNM